MWTMFVSVQLNVSVLLYSYRCENGKRYFGDYISKWATEKVTENKQNI